MAYSQGKLLTITLTAKANEKNLNLREIASLSGIDKEKVSKWLKGTEDPTDDEIKSICKTLGCTVNEIKKSANINTAKTKNIKNIDNNKDKPGKEITKKQDTSNSNVVSDISQTTIRKKTEKKIDVKKMETKEINPPVNKQKENLEQDFNDFTLNKKIDKNVSSKKKKSRNSLLTEDSEAYIRKTIGLKKSDLINKKDVMSTLHIASETIKQVIEELEKFSQDITQKFYDNIENNGTDPKLIELIKIAENASDEGIELAITILKKWKK